MFLRPQCFPTVGQGAIGVILVSKSVKFKMNRCHPNPGINMFLLYLWGKTNQYDCQWWPCGGLSDQFQIQTEHMKPNQPFLNPCSHPAWKVAAGLSLLAMASCPAQSAPPTV